MSKQVFVVDGRQIHTGRIDPGTTTQDLIRQLELPPDTWISKESGLPFSDDEALHDEVGLNEKLFASAPAIVGR